MFYGLGEEERKRIGRKKRKKRGKKRKNKEKKTLRGRKWVGWNERVS